MAGAESINGLEIGYDVPAVIGMAEGDVQTPALVVDLDAFERNLARMKAVCASHGVRLRAHGKTHKCSDVALRQIGEGGAVGVCAQKVSEAEAFVRGGVRDVLVSNQVRDPAKIDRLARLPRWGGDDDPARVIVCVDAMENVAELAAAARRRENVIEVLVEIDCGAGRCGAQSTEQVVAIAEAVAAAASLRFAGIQAYHGAAQHLQTHAERATAIGGAVDVARAAIDALGSVGLACDIVGGGGTGSYELEAASGVFNEVQCGSYAFMDADYGRLAGSDGRRLDETWDQALFVLSSVMSKPLSHRAVCDAGLKSLAVDSGLPTVFAPSELRYVNASDEHGVIEDSSGRLTINERIRLTPGHCDPTCNLHDWFVGVRDGVVETLWPIDGRGKSF